MFKKLISKILVTVLVFAPVTGYCLPANGTVASGTVKITTPNTNTMNVNQGSDKAIINWNSFNIATGQTVNFIQPSASSVALNRIGGSTASSIYGALNANGRVFLINPNGILFSSGSSVNVGGLIATTLNISDKNFLAGNYNFSGTSTAAVQNLGSITSNIPGGYVVLLASNVKNTGAIAVANVGSIALAAGNAATVALDSKGLISVAVTQSTLSKNPNHDDAPLINSGTLTAPGGKIILTAGLVNTLFNNAINTSGVITANKLINNDGTVELVTTGSAANVVQTSPIIASNLTINVAGTVNSNGNISLTKDFTLAKGTFNSDVSKIFSAGGSFSLLGGAFSRYGNGGLDQNGTLIYLIYDVYGLQAMKNHLDWNYALAQDIPASETRNWNGGLGFEPVGNNTNRFTGTLY
jgi:filamentous hemagglutinin family protein